MTKLTFPSIAALVQAFNNGTKFRVIGASSPSYDGPVESMQPNTSHAERGTVVVKTAQAQMVFRLDGSRYYSSYGGRLELIETASAEPFLKRFVNGEPAYNPATREIVIGVSFVKGAIEVLLKDEEGTERVSTKYDHEGRHRWVPGRSLVLGALPPKKVKVTLTVYKDRLYGGYVTCDSVQILPARVKPTDKLATVEIEV